MWLTDYFSWPNWPTYTGFIQKRFESWNDPNNLITGVDTAQSAIENSEVRITIDYEMVDLGEQGPDGEGGSPMSFGGFGTCFLLTTRPD